MAKESEFTGAQGLFGNVDKGGKLEPHQEQLALYQTDTDDAQATPSHGKGGTRIV